MEQQSEKTQSIEIWGGIECTINRIGDTFFNQLDRNGHTNRIEDLDKIAALGIMTIRYPVLWEKIAPEGLSSADWSWADERLAKLTELGIKPIVGFLHHGSGPKYTDLTDPAFPEKFTEYAVAVAKRFPFLEYFTPINEPLTTARFSCLYGHWYPHTTDDKLFAKALLNQCKATIMAMKEIKKIIPSAKLVQTEDLGKVYSTDLLSYQAEFENERRWTSLDLLSGQIKPDSVMWNYLHDTCGISKEDLIYFIDNNFPPDIIGINHYITSERFLDENLDFYPLWSHGGNGRHFYADVEVVRVDIGKRAGHYHLLKETAERYKYKTIALTEVHLGASRDEQMRWFMEAFDAASRLKAEGVNIKAVTAWSLLGAYDWNTLLVQINNFYETGVFDVRSGKPRPTALAKIVTSLCNGKEPVHPILKTIPWWKKAGTVLYGPQMTKRELPVVEFRLKDSTENSHAPILITGGRGTLAKAFANICEIRSIPYVLLTRQDMDIADKDSVNKILDIYKPWAVINAAGFVKVDEAELNREACFRENAEGPKILADGCAKKDIQFLTFSSDLVFDGKNKTPYIESDSPAPLNIYGISKFYAETKVLRVNPKSLIIRTSAFFGPWDEFNFLIQVLRKLSNGENFIASNDQIVSPTYVPDLVNTALDLLIDCESGIWHVSNPAEISWAELAFRTAEIARMNTTLIKSESSDRIPFLAERPFYSALGSEKGIILPTLDNAIGRFLNEKIIH